MNEDLKELEAEHKRLIEQRKELERRQNLSNEIKKEKQKIRDLTPSLTRDIIKGLSKVKVRL